MITFRTEKRTKSRNRRVAAMWIVNVTAMVLLAWALVVSLGETVSVTGRSMEPTLQNGMTVLTDKAIYRLRAPARFDVIAFTGKDEGTGVSVKRIVGLPGEMVHITGGDVYINGKKLTMPHDTTRCAVAGIAQEPILLGEDEYFVLGDWPEVSEDSRFSTVGCVPRENIVGKIWFAVAPLLSVGPIR